MASWRFSWRAVGAWFGAAAIGGAVFAAICVWADLTTSPDDAGDYPLGLLFIWLLGALGVLIIGGFVWLLASALALRVRWPRPWIEALVLAVLCYVVTHVGSVTINVDDAHGPISPLRNFAAFVIEYACTPLTGVVAAYAYWRLAGKPSARV